jgi:hypothetical protein
MEIINPRFTRAGWAVAFQYQLYHDNSHSYYFAGPCIRKDGIELRGENVYPMQGLEPGMLPGNRKQWKDLDHCT